ncbi:hypothetical protein STAS_00391 [Striga asiatica]|uniref:FLZ-type domain-containing protein n=1 Tax=Striga asiatica TaxID=4170 RepID=A0A5A7NWF6_STRAF|nr:hypothetical protein STAS_00391 [Striga asiatica]
MLRNRSRAVKTKQALMADQNQTSLPSPTMNLPPSPISSFLNSPRFFNGLLSKKTQFSSTDTNYAVMSPTSILDSKKNLSFVNHFGHDNIILSKSPNPTAKREAKAIGLALIDSIVQENADDEGKSGKKISKPVNRVNRAALFGSKLKVQIPDLNPKSSIFQNESPKSPAEFGIKTRNSQISSTPVKDLARQLSLKEMELSEDYTCVISHGPNPKTTHIFDDCVVERCLGDHSENNYSECQKMEFGFEIDSSSSPSQDFLSFCHTCKDNLGQGKDIYIYRGEKAFCSHECRCQEMFFEGLKNPDLDG